MAQGRGVAHCDEAHAIWGPGNGGSGATQSYFPGGINANAVNVVQGYWISFIRSYNPNKYRLADTAMWGVYSKASRRRLVFNTGGRTSLESMTLDLQDKCIYLQSIVAIVQDPDADLLSS
jgi:carboxylesterase type B